MTHISTLKQSNEFVSVKFSCRSGGAPRNKIGLSESGRFNRAEYRTVRHGNAYYGEVTINCRNTGKKDSKGRAILEAENGMLFVFRYVSGSPENFDFGEFLKPAE